MAARRAGVPVFTHTWGWCQCLNAHGAGASVRTHGGAHVFLLPFSNVPVMFLKGVAHGAWWMSNTVASSALCVVGGFLVEWHGGLRVHAGGCSCCVAVSALHRAANIGWSSASAVSHALFCFLLFFGQGGVTSLRLDTGSQARAARHEQVRSGLEAGPCLRS